MASSISQIDKPQRGQYPKRAELPDVNLIITGVQNINTERAKILNGANGVKQCELC